MIPATAQVEPADSIVPIDSLQILRDTSMLPSDSLDFSSDSLSSAADTLPDRFELSTDSVYATPVPGQDGLLESMVEYTASDSIVGSISEGKAYLYRDAYVKYKDLELKAGYIMINFNTNEVYAEGIPDSSGQIIQKPLFTESGKSYRADNMRYNFDTKKAKISKVITKEGEGYLHGEEVKKMGEQVFYVKNAAYTTCSHEDPHFNIKTPRAKVIAGDKVVTKFAFLEILEVPTPLMVPFGFFPTSEKRKSGIIMPNYGSSEFRGYFLRGGGYYWAVNDYLDLTLSGDVYTQGGYGIAGQSSYRKRYAYSGNVAVSYTRIKFGREEFQEFVPRAFDDQSTFSIRWNHNQDPKARPDFRFNSNVNIASSNHYKLNSVQANEVLSNTLASSVSFQKLFPGRPFNLNTSLTHSQNNQTQNITLKLPQVSFGMNRQFPFRRQTRVGQKRWYEEIGVSYSATGENSIQSKLGKPLFTESVFRDSSKTGIRHDLGIGANYKVLKFFVFNPNIRYQERWYFNRSEWGYVDSLNRAMVVDTAHGFYGVRDFTSSANLSTKLYGTWRYRGDLRALRHVVTPTVGFSYRPDFAEDFWGYYQEVQTDSLGNTRLFSRYNYGIYGSPGAGENGNINFNLLNTLEAKIRDRDDSTGVKKIKILERVSLGTSYNVAAEEYHWSPLSFRASSSALDNLLSMNYNAIFDFYGYDVEQGRRVSEYAYQVSDQWLRPTSQSLALGINLSARRFKSDKDKEAPPVGQDRDQKEGVIDKMPAPEGIGVTTGDIDYYNQPGFVQFNIPWTLRLDYNIRKSYRGTESNISQSVTASGDFELTQNWRMGFRTGYDLEATDFTYTSLDFYRDLHCWELRATWVPFGIQQSYSLTIRVKSDMLSDLKLERRRGYGDFQR